ncbi:MAG: alkaline phosphatase [Phycisphaerales bacterium JB040]
MSEQGRVSRRGFLRATGLAAAAAAATPAAAYTGSSRRGRARAKNVIFMVSDGMSTGTLTLADMVIRERTGRRSAWLELNRTPGATRSLATTHSADRWVTDSAAGGCAWSLGTKVNNGSINYSPDGVEMTPINVRAKARGMSTGLVTTTRVTHATPASFVAGVPRRDMEDPIAAHILERGTDVCFGGGAKHFPGSLRAAHAGVTFHDAMPDLSGADASSRHCGLFSASHLAYAPDRDASIPSLATMTTRSLAHLSRNPDGFILQVEGGRVDHAAHANDASSLVMEQIEFDEALREAIAWTLGRDDTLLIATTDHANANPGLTLYDRRDSGMLDRLMGANHSFEWLEPRLGEAVENNTLRELIAEASGGYELSDDDHDFLRRGLAERMRTNGFLAQSRTTTSLLGSLLANYHGVAFISPNHTADLVEVAALGPGAELLEPAIDNTDLHALMLSVTGLPEAAPAG